MARRDLWQEVHDRFDPEEAAQKEWRADRKSSPVEQICEALDRPFGAPRVLLTGTVGTGKTTELLRVAEQRAAAGKEFVIVLDLVRHFSGVVGDLEALQHIGSWEVCFLVGVALLRAAEERLGFTFTKEERDDLSKAWAALAKETETATSEPQIDLSALAKSMVLLTSTASPQGTALAAGLTVIDKVVDAVKWALPIGLGKRAPPDQDAAMQSLLASVNRLLGSFQIRAMPVLFVIDGLDRIRSAERARALFLESEMIGRLVCRLVVCGPWALRHDKAVSAVRRFSTLCTLVNEPVLLETDPSQHGPGVGFFCDVFHQRVNDLGGGDLIPDALLRRLAYYSGGRARDFVRSIRMLAARAWDAGADKATEALVDRVIDEARRLMETGIDRGDIALLAAVANDPVHELPDGEKARELLSYGHLLPYPNGSEWFYPHPLLTIRKIRKPPAGPSA